MKLFYDHLINKTALTNLIEKKGKSKKEKQNLHETLDELIHNTVLNVILTHLDEKHHEEFLVMLHKTPHDAGILVYLKKKAHSKIEDKIKKEIKNLKESIFNDLNLKNGL